jgi:hypothetical protein
MTMRLFRHLAMATAVGLLTAIPLGAQGVFNMGSLTQTVSIPTGQTEARRARSAGTFSSAFRPRARSRVPQVNRAALTFRRDPAITRRVQQRLLARMSTPQARAQLQRAFDANMTRDIAGLIKPMGLEYTNLGDALGAFVTTAWQATHGNYDATPAQFRAVSRQMTLAASDAGLAGASNATKQELAETALYEAVMIGSSFAAAKTDRAARAKLARLATAGTQNMFGFDTAQMRMTSSGLAL